MLMFNKTRMPACTRTARGTAIAQLQLETISKSVGVCARSTYFQKTATRMKYRWLSARPCDSLWRASGAIYISAKQYVAPVDGVRVHYSTAEGPAHGNMPREGTQSIDEVCSYQR